MDFKKELLNLDIVLNEEMERRFEIYYNTLVETNEKMNLTAITEKEEVYCKHFLDSLEIKRAFFLFSFLVLRYCSFFSLSKKERNSSFFS